MAAHPRVPRQAQGGRALLCRTLCEISILLTQLMGGGSAVGSSQQPLPGGSGGDACRTSRARSCIAQCAARGHASRAVMHHRVRPCIDAVVTYLLSSRAVAPPAAAHSSPSLTAARSSRSSTAASRVRTRPLRYCARSSHRCAVMHHGSVVGSMRAVAAPALAVRRGRRLLRNHARCGCPRAGREARAKAAP